MPTATKEKPFTIIAERLRCGSTVRILPSHTSVARLHEGRYGMIWMVIAMYDYATRQTSYVYHVEIDGELWPYDDFMVEAVI